MAQNIQIVAHNLNWKLEFREEARKLRKILHPNIYAIHHIGSTAVKGLFAMPIIDIMIVVKNIFLIDNFNQQFSSLGYICLGENGVRGRRYYIKGGENPTHIIQIFQLGDKKQIDRHIAVREYLKHSKDSVIKYGQLKSMLLTDHGNEDLNYTMGKEKFLDDLEVKALLWKKQEDHMSYYLSLGLCLGVCLGTTFGNLYNNLAMGLSLGLTIGVLLGYTLGNNKPKH